jgi:D-beta-D-heptose 7-phosphate kinase/D-beta-D-heptose 1-phosphate adenosyltransferase
MISITRDRAAELVSRFRNLRILVIGDLMIDAYIWGKVNRISPEAPIPIVEVLKEESKPGGAANVGLNLMRLGARTSFSGVTGNDDKARLLTDDLRARGADTSAIVACQDRPTTVKTRIIAQHQQIVRIDRESATPLPPAGLDRLLAAIKPRLAEVDGIILSDYNKGTLQASLVSEVIRLAHGKVITVDPKPANIRLFKGATLITPNKKEAEQAAGFPLQDEESVQRAAALLQSDLSLSATLITRGEEGMSLFDGSQHTNIPTQAKNVFDVTGAGDTVISVATLALCAGATPLEASVLANIAAGITVAHLGVYAVSPEELLAAVGKEAS